MNPKDKIVKPDFTTKLYLERNLENAGCPKSICYGSGTVSFVQKAEELTQVTGAMDLNLTHKEKLSKNLKVERHLGGVCVSRNCLSSLLQRAVQ